MEKWSFNMELFSGLTKVLDISEGEIARRCGLDQPVLNRYMNGKSVLPVDVLIQICNGLRMPTHYFVSQDDNHVIPEREYATLSVGRWQSVEWDRQAVELTFGNGEGKIYWQDVAVAMDVTPQKPHNRFLLRTRFPIDDFLQTCNNLGLSPFRFLIDQNKADNLKRKGKGRAARGNATPPPQSAADIAALTRKIDNLSTTVADLAEKYDSLLRAHEALARCVNVNIENIHNSSVNIATDGHK